MNKMKIIFSSAAISLGTFLFVFGEYDDSPGGQLIGIITAIIGITGIAKDWEKNS